MSEQKHTYLNYQKVIINYIFSFSWDIIEFDFNTIQEKLLKNNTENPSHWKWKSKSLHERHFWGINEDENASYHPTIVSKNLRSLISSELMTKDVNIVAPYYNKNKERDYKKMKGDLYFDTRLFENGTGTITFSIILDEDELSGSDAASFEKIMLAQHLATSIDNNKDSKKHITDSFIKVSNAIKNKYHLSDNDIYLAEMFTKLLNHYRELKGIVWAELTALDGIGNEQFPSKNWQTPYVVTNIEVKKDCLERLVDRQEPGLIKEVGAIAVRLALDNNEDVSEYQKQIRREYVYRALGFYTNPEEAEDKAINAKGHKKQIRLRNYSHSNNLFYTYGRRAAVAITSDFSSHPAYFVLPTFMNILEILRSRWQLGTITNMFLDETFEKVAHNESVDDLVNEIFKCRVLYGLFLQNPTPYLFDSGAVTEIADSADQIFWLEKIGLELERKLIALDRLVDVIYAKQRLRKYGVKE